MAKRHRKGVRLRSASKITFGVETAAVKPHFRPGEITTLETLGLDMFFVRVTWENVNAAVVAEVLDNMEPEGLGSMVNEKKFNIFPEDMREYMKTLFCLVPYKRVIGLNEEKLQITSLFTKAKEAGKKTMVKISDCSHDELKKPLKLINSLMLMRLNSQTIPLSFIKIIVRALNGERVDWPLILHKHWVAELQLISQNLSTEKNHVTKSMIGAHLTLLLAARGLLTIQQETVARIFDIPKFLEEVNMLGKKKQRGDTGKTSKGTNEKVEEIQTKDIDMLPTT